MRNRLGICGLAIVAVATLAAGCAGESADAPQTDREAEVEVVNIAYSPATLEIEVGTEVTWTNQDEGVRHTVTSGLPGDNGVPGVSEGKPPKPDGVFDGDLPDAGESFSFTFDKAGTYEYFCRIHPSMTAEVVAN